MKNQSAKRLISCFLFLSLAAGAFCLPAGAAVRTAPASPAVSVQGETVEAAVGNAATFMTDRTEAQTPVDAAGATWKKVGTNLRLQSSSGRYKTGFVKYNGKQYYFNASGNLKTGFFTTGGQTYYASVKKGAAGKGQILTGLVKIGSHHYYLNPASKPAAGAVAKGFQTIRGRRYYFNSAGHMVTGWFSVSGSTYYASCNKKGHLGMLLTGVKKIGSKTYRLDSSGRLLGVVSGSGSAASSKYLHMIDISVFQGDINFSKVKADGVGAIIIRAGYGKGNIDSKFYQNIKGAKAAGIPVGIYWFSYAYTKQMAVNEAKYVLNAVKGYKLNLPIYFDWEYDSMDKARAAMGKKAFNKVKWRDRITEMTAAFCDTITKNGYRAGYYFNLAYLNSYYNPSRLTKYSTWYAYWGTNKPGSNVWKHADKMDTPVKYDLWQFTSRGKISGIKGNVDCDLLLHSSIKK